jgi:hypothetical protein
VFGYIVIRKCLALNDVHGMEKMNQDIPFEHQMMFIIRDYDRKVEENMELRKEVEELSAALEKQGVQLHDAKVDLKNEIKKEEEVEKALKKKPKLRL